MIRPAPRIAGPAWVRPLIVVIAVAAVLAGVTLAFQSVRPTAPSRHRAAGARAAAQARTRRDAQFRSVLGSFAQAVLQRHPASVLHIIDRSAARFRAAELRWFRDTRSVRFASWSIELGADEAAPAANRVAVAGSVLRYRLAGFDVRPVSQPIDPVFVRRPAGWRIAALSGRADGLPPPTELWDFEAVRAVHAPGVVVFGSPEQLGTVHELAAIAAAAIPRVTAVWGLAWSRRAVLLVPASQQQFGRISGFHGALGAIAAVTNAEIHTFGPADPAGDRIAINPQAWAQLSPVGRQIVVTHELTHVATRAATGARTPKWLSEGFAEWVSFKGSGVPITVAAAALRGVMGSGPPRHFPSDAAFHGGPSRLDVAYDEAWLAVASIAAHWGEPAFIRFYRAVGTSSLPPAAAVRDAARRVLRTQEPRLITDWRRLLTADFG